MFILLGHRARSVSADCISDTRLYASAAGTLLERVPPAVIGLDALIGQRRQGAHPLGQPLAGVDRRTSTLTCVVTRVKQGNGDGYIAIAAHGPHGLDVLQ